MQLLRSLCLAFASAIAAALVLSCSCSAASHDAEASSSRWPKSAPPEPPTWSDSKVEYFIHLLSPERIALLPSRTRQYTGEILYPDTPFYFGTPLFTTRTDVGTVEQALRDFRAVGIAHLSDYEARLIVYDQGRLTQRLFPDSNSVLRLYGVDPNLHTLRKMLYHPVRTLPEESILALPFVRGRPILLPDSDSLSHMLRAAHMDQKKFYHVRLGHDTILVDPREASLYATVTGQEKQEVDRVVAGYQAARGKYGEGLASVLWGRPIHPITRFQENRMKPTPSNYYPRYTRETAREQMVEALQVRGRFKIYLSGPRGRTAYKVKVKNPDAPGSAVMEFSVEPLSVTERAAEALQAAMGRIRLPA